MCVRMHVHEEGGWDGEFLPLGGLHVKKTEPQTDQNVRLNDTICTIIKFNPVQRSLPAQHVCAGREAGWKDTNTEGLAQSEVRRARHIQAPLGLQGEADLCVAPNAVQ